MVIGGTLGTGSTSVQVRDRIVRLRAGSINADIAVTAATGLVQNIETTTGGFSGSLSVFELSAPVLGVDGGIFVAGDLAADLSFDSSIYWPIEVGGSLTGSVNIGLNLSGDSGFIGGIYVDGPVTGVIDIANNSARPIVCGQIEGVIAMGGNLVNTITADGIADGGVLYVGADLNATVTFTGEIEEGGLVLVGRSLLSSALIDIKPAYGLAGQIVVNANNSSGVWTSGAVVTIATDGSVFPSIDLASADYDDPSTGNWLGGGAVGLARYAVYEVR